MREIYQYPIKIQFTLYHNTSPQTIPFFALLLTKIAFFKIFSLQINFLIV